MNKALKLTMLMAVTLLLTSCSVRFNDAPAGALNHQTKEVEAGGARATLVDLEMGAGVLTVLPATLPGSAMRATFTYNESAGEPRVTYAVQEGVGKLALSQSRGGDVIYLRNFRNKWDVDLSDMLTEKLNVAIGAGNANLNLGGLPLRHAQVAAGAGFVLLDLTGKWESDATVDVSTGAGRLEIRLPDETGVEVHMNSHLGGLQTYGLEKVDSGVYRNDVYGTTSTTLRVNIAAGVGEVFITVAR